MSTILLSSEEIMKPYHQFVYGRKGDVRTNFLLSSINDYPLNLDSNKHVAIYIDKFGVPPVSQDIQEFGNNQLALITRLLINSQIVLEILSKTLTSLDNDELNRRATELISRVNILYKNKLFPNLNDLDDFHQAILESCQIWQEMYNRYINSGEMPSMDKSVLNVTILESFVMYYKKMINLKSSLCVFFDNKAQLSITSQKFINQLINSRTGGDFVVKVVTDPNDWRTYTTINDQLITNPHDYKSIELDNSQRKRTKRK